MASTELSCDETPLHEALAEITRLVGNAPHRFPTHVVERAARIVGGDCDADLIELVSEPQGLVMYPGSEILALLADLRARA